MSKEANSKSRKVRGAHHGVPPRKVRRAHHGVPQHTANSDGYALFISVIVLGSVFGTLAVSALVGGSTLLSTQGYQRDGMRAHAYADACAEEALQEVRDTAGYSGAESLSFADGSCRADVTSGSGQSHTIEADGKSGRATRRVVVEVSSVRPSVEVSSWQEVATF